MPARPWLIPLIAASAVAGCSAGASCYDVTLFSSNPKHFDMVNVSGYEAFDCTVTLSSQGRSAVTSLKARAPSTTAPPPSAPTYADDLACRGFDTPDAQFCSQTSGPGYTLCARTPTCLRVIFSNAEANSLATFLGGTGAYDIRIECGGVVVASSTNVPSRVQECAL